jgi:tetratricopeptide (TPR) repeat protein
MLTGELTIMVSGGTIMRKSTVRSILSVLIGLVISAGIGCSSLTPASTGNPEEARGYFEESLAKSNEWDFQGALNAIERAIELDPSNSAYVMFRGTYQGLLGDRLAPLRALDKALEMDPGNPRYYNNRAAVLMQLGLYEESRKDAELTIELGNARLRWAAMDTISWIHYLTGEYGRALDTLHKIEVEFPENSAITSLLRYRILYDTDGPQAAVDYGRQVLTEGSLPALEENGMRLLLGMVDLRDIEINHVFVI